MGGGGGYYDRDVTSTDGTYSDTANTIFTQTNLHPDLDPKNKIVTSSHGNPIVVAIDVTGSMGDWTKIIFDKMPLFYGQLIMQGYLTDPEISFAAIGDATSDRCPLQISDFAQGSAIDTQLAKLYLEGNGGGQTYESYELAAFYYANRCDVSSATSKPFLFITGDEGMYDPLNKNIITNLIGVSVENDVSCREIFSKLREKFHVFHVKKPYSDSSADARILSQWESIVGPESILRLQTPKAVVDIMLGAIALRSGTRTVDRYCEDLVSRGQEPDRIAEVRAALSTI